MSVRLVQVQASPYRELGDDYFASSCSFCLCVVFVCCIVLKIETLTEVTPQRRKP